MSERDDVTERAKRLLDAATPGPWEVRIGPGDVTAEIGAHEPLMVSEWFRRRDRKQAIYDAELVAAAPTLIADLVAEVERLRERGSFAVCIDTGPDLWVWGTHEAVTEVQDIKAERDKLRAELDAAQLRSIEARNPGIDMDEVRRIRARLIDGEAPA